MYEVRCTTEALSSAHVRCTMYDVRCTIAIIARFARGERKRAGRRRTGRVVPVSQFAMFARVARGSRASANAR